jgi:hypothetical protein
MPATTNINNWDFHSIHVEEDLSAGQFINAESTLICAGPPRVSDASETNDVDVYPIGLVENVGISQSKQLQRIFEIGSARSYFIPGRVIGSFSMGRVIFNGNSLLRTMYAWMDLSTIGAEQTDQLLDTSVEADVLTDLGGIALNNNPTAGFDGAWFNMNSPLFNQPFGMMFMLRDQVDQDWASFYLEVCHPQGHQFSISSGSVLLLEAVTAQFDQLVPVAVSQ